MKRILLMIAAVGLTAMLVLGNPSVASHWANENPHEKFTSEAGDPAYIEDAQDCWDQIGEDGDRHCVVLYGHVFDLLNAVPINIQRPSPNCDSLARGFTSTPPVEPYWSFNRISLFSSPGFVEYNQNDCDSPRLHPERGLTSDVNVAQDVDILGYWYMSADMFEVNAIGLNTGGQGPLPHMGVLPCLTVRMELHTQRFVGQGELLAAGQTTKTVVSTPYGQGINEELPIPQPPCPSDQDPGGVMNATEVTEFKINLGQISREIREHEGFVVGVQWWFHDMGDPDWSQDKVYHREWNLHTGPDYPNRIVLAVEDSVRVERVQPQLFDGKIYIHSVLNSPWGSYDVDTQNIRVQVFDENGNEVADHTSAHMADPILRYSVDHDGHFKPVNATFPWDFEQEGLEPGDYTIRVTVTNWQHTHDAYREAGFTIRDDLSVEGRGSDGEIYSGDNVDTGEAPGVGIIAAALAAVVLAGIVSLRRRQ